MPYAYVQCAYVFVVGIMSAFECLLCIDIDVYIVCVCVTICFTTDIHTAQQINTHKIHAHTCTNARGPI